VLRVGDHVDPTPLGDPPDGLSVMRVEVRARAEQQLVPGLSRLEVAYRDTREELGLSHRAAIHTDLFDSA
jgi:hypothetical protein